MELTENNYIILIAIGVAAVAFLGITLLNAHAPKPFEEINGVKVYGGMPAISAAFSAQKLAVQVMLEEDKPIPCMSKTWIESASALGSTGKDITNHVNINGSCLGENKTAETCPTANLVLKEGNCNCIRTNASQVEINGDDSFYCNNQTAVRIRQIIQTALRT
ncbi:TPA: hypothetical protein HA318_04640 [Candidatus Micrarchaeota archaeon]|nr:hypothetical protein [Candidatus Micrarchaeota archaeon]